MIGALLLVVIAAGYQLDIAELAYSTRGWDGNVQAALYTDMNAQYPAYEILTVVALVSAGLLLLNTWFRTLWLLGLAAGAWFLLSIVVGGLYPAFVQRVQVEPNELTVELPYIRNHLEATRDAFDLDAIETRPFTGEQELSREVFSEDQPTIDNLRLWDYRPLLTTFGQQQNLRRYYRFADVDIDRYQIDDEQREIMLSARELDVELFGPNRTWTQEKLVYTHGYGITAVPVDAVTPAGTPDYLVSGINREPQLPITEPRIYFGEETDTYVVTSTTTAEFDYPLDTDASGEAGTNTVWDGTTGVDIGNPISRLLFALRFGDFNLLISGQLTDDSQILFRRDIEERVREIAPFLAYDHDPYLVSAEGRLVWVWDAYTVTDRYPNAQPLGQDSRFAGANYVRNSVKVVVDAYNGTVRLFLADPGEPIAAAYARIFPDLFEPLDAMPEELRAHLRYPEDLFVAQNQAFRLYHLPATDGGASTFYNQDDRWAIPEDVTAGGDQPMEPYYVIMRVPGEDAAEFVLIQPMVPEGRPNMIAWVAARMDPGVYGEKIAFQFPTGTTTQGPVQIEARINADDAISEQFTLWSNAGSQVVRGNLLVLPIGEDALLYVEPIFLQAQGAPFPEFVRVIMADQNRVAFAETVEEGLAQLLGEAEPPPPEEPGAVADAGRVARAIALADPGRAARRLRQSRRGGAAPVRRGAGRAGGRRPRHVPGANRRAGRGARCPGRARQSASGRPRPRIRGARARAGLAAGTRRGGAARSNGPRQRRHAGRRRERRPGPRRSAGGRPARGARALRPRRHRSRGAAGGRGGRRAGWHAIPAFGPTRAAARLESSKAFAKRQMERAGVATAVGHDHRSGRWRRAPSLIRSTARREGRLAGRRQGRRRAGDERGGRGRGSRAVRGGDGPGPASCSRNASRGSRSAPSPS